MSVRLLLLEPQHSTYARQIAAASAEAGLSIGYLDGVGSVPAGATLIGIGPSLEDPLQVARELRGLGGHALLIFFTASSTACDALHAELVRDPFLYPRFEIVELPDTARQLASRMGKVASHVKGQLHAGSSRRRPRSRARTPSPTQPPAGSDLLLAHVLEQARDAIIATDPAGRITTWNEAAEQLFGFEASAVIGRSIEVLDATDSRPISDVVRGVARRGTAEETRLCCATARGGSLEVAVKVGAIRDAQGATVGVSVVARDEAEYRRLQQALQEASRQKDEFLAIMSHELRTPLTSILGYTDMLLRGLAGPLEPLTSKYLGNVRSAGDRLLELVNGLLDYTRLEAGVEHLDLKPVDLRRLVAQCVENFHGVARASGIDLQLATSPNATLKAEADEERVRHVLRSILGNALKFTPTGGWVRVHVGRDPQATDELRVSISDSGIGMREEQLGRVWDRFYQGDPSLTRPYGGMGLGLAIASHLVALHGGAVGAESRGPGLGSTFWFTLRAA